MRTRMNSDDSTFILYVWPDDVARKQLSEWGLDEETTEEFIQNGKKLLPSREETDKTDG